MQRLNVRLASASDFREDITPRLWRSWRLRLFQSSRKFGSSQDCDIESTRAQDIKKIISYRLVMSPDIYNDEGKGIN